MSSGIPMNAYNTAAGIRSTQARVEIHKPGGWQRAHVRLHDPDDLRFQATKLHRRETRQQSLFRMKFVLRIERVESFRSIGHGAHHFLVGLMSGTRPSLRTDEAGNGSNQVDRASSVSRSTGMANTRPVPRPEATGRCVEPDEVVSRAPPGSPTTGRSGRDDARVMSVSVDGNGEVDHRCLLVERPTPPRWNTSALMLKAPGTRFLSVLTYGFTVLPYRTNLRFIYAS